MTETDRPDLGFSAQPEEKPKFLVPRCGESPAPDTRTGRPTPTSGAIGHAPPLVPTDEQCLAWWDTYEMLAHIREHSMQVATIATTLASWAVEAGLPDVIAPARAAGLLHDLAKTYTIKYGGNHSQLGAAWVQELTRNPAIAQAIVHHVWWPFELDVDRHFLQLALIYSDKRVMHTDIVTLGERFDDIIVRYGKTEEMRRRIGTTMRQAEDIERVLADRLGKELHAYSFDRRRLE